VAYLASTTMGCVETVPRVKRLEHESNCLPQSSTEVKNGWSYTSIAPVCPRGMVIDSKEHKARMSLFTVSTLQVVKRI